MFKPSDVIYKTNAMHLLASSQRSPMLPDPAFISLLNDVLDYYPSPMSEEAAFAKNVLALHRVLSRFVSHGELDALLVGIYAEDLFCSLIRPDGFLQKLLSRIDDGDGSSPLKKLFFDFSAVKKHIEALTSYEKPHLYFFDAICKNNADDFFRLSEAIFPSDFQDKNYKSSMLLWLYLQRTVAASTAGSDDFSFFNLMAVSICVLSDLSKCFFGESPDVKDTGCIRVVFSVNPGMFQKNPADFCPFCEIECSPLLSTRYLMTGWESYDQSFCQQLAEFLKLYQKPVRVRLFFDSSFHAFDRMDWEMTRNE